MRRRLVVFAFACLFLLACQAKKNEVKSSSSEANADTLGCHLVLGKKFQAFILVKQENFVSCETHLGFARVGMHQERNRFYWGTAGTTPLWEDAGAKACRKDWRKESDIAPRSQCFAGNESNRHVEPKHKQFLETNSPGPKTNSNHQIQPTQFGEI